MVSDHPAKFGGNKEYDSGNIMILVCHNLASTRDQRVK